MDSQIKRLFAHLQQHAGKWVPMPELVRVSGSYVIHSRIADLRRKKLGKFDNRTERHDDGVKRIIHSYYRLTPKRPRKQKPPGEQ